MSRIRLASRSGAVLTALALLVPLAGPAAAQPAARDTAEACDGAPEDGFTDTGGDGSVQESAVDCISWYEVTRGRTATTYEPGDPISRGQMATMIAEVMRGSNEDFSEPEEGSSSFSDTEGTTHEDNIEFVAFHGIVNGYPDGTYRPGEPVTRGQMATFLANTLVAIGADLTPSGTDHFTDDDGTTHEENINALADQGIATGRGGTNYEPGAPVTRGQMALFVSRALDLLVEATLTLRPDQRDVQVTLNETEVERGEIVTGEILGEDVESATVSGCGLTDEPVEDDGPSQDGIQFSLTIPAEQELGDCDLVFTVTLTDASTVDRTRTITVVENTAFEVTVNDESGAAGLPITGSIVPDPDDGMTLEGATLDGCGFSDEVVEDTDANTDGVQFVETIPAEQPAGACTLTFTLTYGSVILGLFGETETHEIGFLVT